MAAADKKHARASSSPHPSASQSASDSDKSIVSQDLESHLQDVVQARRSGAITLMHQAAKDHCVTYGTLRNCMLGGGDRHQGHEHEQLLSDMQQMVLIDWCQYHSRMALPLTCIQVPQKVTELAGSTPGKNWISRFLKKNADMLYSGKWLGLFLKKTANILCFIFREGMWLRPQMGASI